MTTINLQDHEKPIAAEPDILRAVIVHGQGGRRNFHMTGNTPRDEVEARINTWLADTPLKRIKGVTIYAIKDGQGALVGTRKNTGEWTWA